MSNIMKKTHKHSKIIKLKPGYVVDGYYIRTDMILQRIIYPDGSELIEYIPHDISFREDGFFK